MISVIICENFNHIISWICLTTKIIVIGNFESKYRIETEKFRFITILPCFVIDIYKYEQLFVCIVA